MVNQIWTDKDPNFFETRNGEMRETRSKARSKARSNARSKTRSLTRSKTRSKARSKARSKTRSKARSNAWSRARSKAFPTGRFNMQDKKHGKEDLMQHSLGCVASSTANQCHCWTRQQW